MIGLETSDRSQKGHRKNSSLLSRDVKLVLAYLFLNSVPIGYMNVVPLIYLIQVGYAPNIVSIIYAASAISNTLGLTPFGLLADKFGRKKFLIIGSVIPAISYVIFGLTLDPYWLIVASALGGVGLAGGLAVAISGPPLLPIIADTASVENRTKVFGVVQAAWTVALTVGSVLALLPDIFRTHLSLGNDAAHSLSYYLMAVLIVISILPLIFVQERKQRPNQTFQEIIPVTQERILPIETSDPQEQGRLGFGWWQKTRSKLGFVSAREIKRFAAVYALSGLGLGISVQLLASWYNLSFHTTESVAGLWIAFAELLSATSLFFIPFFVRKWGTLRASAITGAIGAIFLGAMTLSNIFLLVAILFAIRSIFVNISWPILQSYLMGVVDEKERAAATGIATTAWGLANSIGTLIGGALLSAGLLSLPFVIGSLSYLCSALAMGYLFRGLKPPEERDGVSVARV